MVEAFDAEDYAEIAKQADAIAEASVEAAEWSDR